MKTNITRIIGFLLLANFIGPIKTHAQAMEIIKPVYSDVSIPLRDMKPAKIRIRDKWKKEVEPEYVIPNHFRPTSTRAVTDPAVQKVYNNGGKSMASSAIMNFDGLNNGSNSGRYTPPDPAGDVGPNHYVQAVNCILQIFSKTGVSLLGPEKTSTLWNGFPGNWDYHNDGDAVVLYDENADRWLISQFAIKCGVYPNYTQYQLVAVSTTPDPTGSYYRYAYSFDYMPDYPKIGVWNDGYYMAVNRFNTNASGTPFIGAGACVMDRSKMLTGDPTAGMIYFKTENLGGSGSSAGNNCYSMLPSDCDGTFPAAGTPNYFVYEDPGYTQLIIWALHADWTTPANSTFTYATGLTVAAFNELGSASVSQLGSTLKLDGLGDRLMYRNQYRNFGSYEAFVTCHSVNAGGGVAGLRWYEYRKTGSIFSLYQQSTYNPGDGKSRWMGSIAMNAAGDIGIAYSVAGSSYYPSIYFTGRKAGDALNQLTIPEGVILNGGASMTGTYTRWGDYTALNVDPSDNQTFWTTQEYVGVYGGGYPWATKIASFKFANRPIVITQPVTTVTSASAIINGTINPNGYASDYHFEWGTSVLYGNSTTSTAAGSGSSVLGVNAGLSGLSNGTTYHFRLVATSTEGTAYGNDLTFTAGAAVVTTAAVTGITSGSASGGGNILTDGGTSVIARGICWGLSAYPLVSGFHTTDGTGAGSYTSTISGLTANTTYHMRAYSTNGSGTFYGDDIPFTTLCNPFSLPFSENFATTATPSCWSQTDHQSNGQVWLFGVISSQSPNPALNGNYAYLNSRSFGSGNSQNADLVSPTFDLTSYIGVSLQFSHYFLAGSGSSGTISYSTDNGNSWNVLQTFTTTTANPAAYNSVIAALDGQPQVKFKWNYSGTYGYSWAIDNISLSGTYVPTWSGTAGTDWNTSTNWTNNTIPATSANIIIPSNGVSSFPVITSSQQCVNLNILAGAKITINPLASLAVTGTLTNNAGNTGILIKSDASGSGSLMHNTANVPGTLERYISGSNSLTNFIYHFVSVPLTTSNASTSNLFLGSYLFDFSESLNNWNAYSASTTANLDETKGYMLYYPGNQITYAIPGNLNNGSFTPTITGINSPGINRGWNLVPNPYPSSIDWDLVATRSNVDDAIYIWPGTAGPGATNASYYSYVGGVSLPAAAMNGEVAVGQSFFVHANAASPSITFTNASRLNGTKPFLKTDTLIPDLLYLQATSVGVSDYTAVRFSGSASAGFDGNLDAYKLSGTEGTPQISSETAEGLRLSINSLPGGDKDVRIPLHFEMSSNAEVHFKVTGLESFHKAIPVYLEDRQLKTLINLRSQPEYSFSHNPENSPDRFSLLFVGSYGQAAAENQPEARLLTAGELHYLEIPSMLNKEVTLSINDALGRQISVSREINTGIIQLKTPASRGVYFIRVQSGTSGWTGKFIY